MNINLWYYVYTKHRIENSVSMSNMSYNLQVRQDVNKCVSHYPIEVTKCS